MRLIAFTIAVMILIICAMPSKRQGALDTDRSEQATEQPLLSPSQSDLKINVQINLTNPAQEGLPKSDAAATPPVQPQTPPQAEPKAAPQESAPPAAPEARAGSNVPTPAPSREVPPPAAPPVIANEEPPRQIVAPPAPVIVEPARQACGCRYKGECLQKQQTRYTYPQQTTSTVVNGRRCVLLRR